ncbi:MAG: serine/threonine-protein kinase [Planctomycetaceae bacterium]
MAESDISQFVRTLAASRLLTDAQLATLRKQLVGNPLTAEGLAQILVRQGHLTDWQAAQLLKGQSGFVLQQYRLLYPIGRGGMGQVFCARNTLATDQDDSRVAVKVMAKKLTGNETLVSRFRREIRASSRLNSPHIVRTLDAGRVGKVDFMVMEYVNGEQVDRIANRCERLPVGIACDMIRQVALGLQHAHEHQMVHRDIKPGNMMVHWDNAGTGIVKLMDMGLVLVLSDSGSSDNAVTRAGQVMGTPEYMSPEQGWDTANVDIRSDIYSLGCTLFRLLTGKLPFTGTNPLQVLGQRLQRDAPSVKTICDDIPDAVAAVVCRMTLRDPDARYQTPADVAAALHAVSQPLTRQALQTCIAATGGTPERSASHVDGGNQREDSDGTYHQFLKEVQEHSDVELMLATDPSDSASVSTIPSFELKPPASGNARKATRSGTRTATRTRRQVGLTAFGVAGIVGVIGAGWMFSGPQNGDVPTPVRPAAVVADVTEEESLDAVDTGPVEDIGSASVMEPQPQSPLATELPSTTSITPPVVPSPVVPTIVLPTELNQVLPVLSVQKATAGMPFRFSVPAAKLPKGLVDYRCILQPGPDVPAGLTISEKTQEIVWDVPRDVSGMVRFTLAGRLESSQGIHPLKGTIIVQIDVAEATTTPEKTLPEAADIDSAVVELKDTYRTALSGARSSAEKVILANRLLQQSYSADSGVSDAALLAIVDELATKAKATDVLMETSRLRSLRYGTDELTAASATVKSFRKASLSTLQQDLTIEHALRLAHQATAVGNLTLTAQLLQLAKALMGRNATGASAALAADVTVAEQLARELAEPTTGTVDDIRAAELLRLVERWQFQPFLVTSKSLAYVEAASTTATPDNGRSLWTLKPDSIHLQSATLPSMLGILDRSESLDRYVLRFQLAAGCNCAQLIFGAGGQTSTDFDAFRIVLNPAAFGSIQAFRSNAPLNSGTLPNAVQNFFEVANLVEVAVDGAAVAVRINGTAITQAQIPSLTKGMLGFAADLRRPAPELLIRQPRILRLPSNP